MVLIQAPYALVTGLLDLLNLKCVYKWSDESIHTYNIECTTSSITVLCKYIRRIQETNLHNISSTGAWRVSSVPVDTSPVLHLPVQAVFVQQSAADLASAALENAASSALVGSSPASSMPHPRRLGLKICLNRINQAYYTEFNIGFCQND